MPVLPLIDALIFVGWSSLMVSFVLKGISISTRYQPSIFGLSAVDFLTFAMVCMLFAVALAARTWVRVNEHRVLRASRLNGPRELTTPEGAADAAEPHPEPETSVGRQAVGGR